MFYVKEVEGPAIPWLCACEQMRIVTFNAIKSSANCSSVPADNAQKQFPDPFDRIGSGAG